MSTVLGLLSNALSAVAGFFGWAKDRQALRNTPAQQANATARTDQQIKDDAAATVARGDLEKIRQDAAE